jgi:hypothetical protein
MIVQLFFYLLGGFSTLALEFTVWDYVILQPIRDFIAPFAILVEQILELA